MCRCSEASGTEPPSVFSSSTCSSLDLLSILSTSWSHVSCCSSNCCNFVSTGRVERSQEKRKCFLRGHCLLLWKVQLLWDVHLISLDIQPRPTPPHTTEAPPARETETWRILLFHSLEERKATERGCKSLLESAAQN